MHARHHWMAGVGGNKQSFDRTNDCLTYQPAPTVMQHIYRFKYRDSQPCVYVCVLRLWPPPHLVFHTSEVFSNKNNNDNHQVYRCVCVFVCRMLEGNFGMIIDVGINKRFVFDRIGLTWFNESFYCRLVRLNLKWDHRVGRRFKGYKNNGTSEEDI